MELKVWVEGLQRVICGVNETTTCQDVVIALAQATGKTGRFTLIEKWRENERLLAPNNNPVLILRKWGEYSSEVHFILRQSDKPSKKPGLQFRHNFSIPQPGNSSVKKALSFSGAHSINDSDRKHIQRTETVLETVDEASNHGYLASEETNRPSVKQNKTNSNVAKTDNYVNTNITTTAGLASPSHKDGSTRNGDVKVTYNSLDRLETRRLLGNAGNSHQAGRGSRANGHRQRPVAPPSYESLYGDNISILNNLGPSSKLEHYAKLKYGQYDEHGLKDPVNGHSNSSHEFTEVAIEEFDLDQSLLVDRHRHVDLDSGISSDINVQQFPEMREGDYHPAEMSGLTLRALGSELDPGLGSGHTDTQEQDLNTQEYQQLLKVLQSQQDKISVQNAHISHMDSDIRVCESHEMEHNQQLSLLESQINELEVMSNHYTKEISQTDTLTDTLDVETQNQKRLQSQTIVMKSKLSNCESQLQKKQIELYKVLSDLEEEKEFAEQWVHQHKIRVKEELTNLRKQMMETASNQQQLQDDISKLEKEILLVEESLSDKQQEVTVLESDIKSVNLSLFLSAPSSECLGSSVDSSEKTDRESVTRQSRVRKMTSSPHDLANIAPSTKHPHGLWV